MEKEQPVVRFFEFAGEKNETNACRKAKEWLDNNHINYELVDLATKPVTPEEFARWINDSGLKNQEFIEPGNDALRDKTDKMDVKALADLLASHLHDIKRPILEINRTTVLFGFEESKYAEHLGDANERYMKNKD